MNLTINSLIQIRDDLADPQNSLRVQRVLHIDASTSVIVVIDMMNDKSYPEWHHISTYADGLEKGSIVILEADPWLAKPRLTDELSRAATEGLERAWEIIKPIVLAGPEVMLDSSKRGILIRDLLRLKISTKPTINMYLQRYWRGGQTSFALIPQLDKRGGKGKTRLETAKNGKKRGRPSTQSIATDTVRGMNIDETARKLLVKLGQEYYETPDGLSLRKVYDDHLADFFNKGYSIGRDGKVVPILADIVPSFDQFKRWYYLSKDRDTALIKRVGQRQYDLQHRPLTGESTSMAFGPGSIYQIDATIGDIYLVSSLDRRLVIGRPVIYVVVDVFSRMVVGFYVGLEGPSWLGMMLAFQNVATNKVKFCKSLGIDISADKWPVHHLPRAVIGDRGELESKDASILVTGFEVRVSNTPPYRPDWKGIVERHFRLVNEKIIDWLPGAVKMNVRGGRDYRLDSALTLNELRQLLALTFLEHNETHILHNYVLDDDMKKDHLVATPLKLWEWGIKNRTGGLRYFSEEAIKLGLLPRSEATVTSRGLYYRQKYYTCSYIDEHGWRTKARDGSWKVVIAYHPWLPSKIWLKADEREDLIECTEVAQRAISGGQHWAELQLSEALANYNGKVTEAEVKQTKIAYANEINNIKDNAKRELDKAMNGSSERERLKDFKANRQAERDLEQQEHIQDLPSEEDGETMAPASFRTSIPLFGDDVSSALDSVYSNLSDLEEE